MSDHPVVILGVEIPSDAPVFLAFVGLHVLIALVCVVAGIAAMFSKKGIGRHSAFGSIYYWSLSLVFVTATILSVMRWDEDYHLFILGVLAFGAASIGRTAARRHWPQWVKIHLTSMAMSFIVLLTAFYVDNGKSLPLWKELPSLAYWIIPSAIGIPLIVRTLRRHPLTRR
jgi:hypothetical protein